MAVWKETENWAFEYFDINEKLPKIAPFESFIDLWQEKRGTRLAPAWNDFQLEDLTEWWGSVIVLDCQQTPFDFCYRLFGSNAVQLFGLDITGKWASELIGGEYDLEDDIPFYEMLVQNPSMSYTYGSIHWQNRHHIKCAFLELPLSDDNKTITNMISILHHDGVQ
ncbi:MAG: PAS domain-containing protein [Rhodospirillales bacterium]|jgi:hypothetical protein|nr:PAS domain-containing protein [Rhodospirillales bacterium]